MGRIAQRDQKCSVAQLGSKPKSLILKLHPVCLNSLTPSMADDVEQITGNLACFRRLGGECLNEMTSDLTFACWFVVRSFPCFHIKRATLTVADSRGA